MQYAKFPMKYVNITQVPNGGYSHKGRLAVDNAGKDAGIDSVFAPYDCKIVWKDTGSAKTGILIENTGEVLCADGIKRSAQQIQLMLWHDNDISDLYVGKEIKQGQVFYQEGTAGQASGNHLHFNVGLFDYTSGYPMIKNSDGNWEVKNEVDPTKIFFIDDSNVVIKTMGMNWVKYDGTKFVDDVSKVPDAAIKINDKVKVIGTNYATGKEIPDWVKKNIYTVSKLSNGKALLAEIKSYVYVKDLKKA